MLAVQGVQNLLAPNLDRQQLREAIARTISGLNWFNIEQKAIP